MVCGRRTEILRADPTNALRLLCANPTDGKWVFQRQKRTGALIHHIREVFCKVILPARGTFRTADPTLLIESYFVTWTGQKRKYIDNKIAT